MQGLLGGITNSAGSSAISSAGQSLLDFDPVSYVDDAVHAATVRGQTQLQETNSTIGNAIGGTAGDNTMAALLAQRGSNDLAASLAGVRNQATSAAADIMRQNVSTAAGVNASQASTIAQIGQLLKGATTTTNQTTLESQIAQLLGQTSQATQTAESANTATAQNTASSQLVNELVNALINQTTNKVGTEDVRSKTKSGGFGIAATA